MTISIVMTGAAKLALERLLSTRLGNVAVSSTGWSER
jgi:hypothetical protein